MKEIEEQNKKLKEMLHEFEGGDADYIRGYDDGETLVEPND